MGKPAARIGDLHICPMVTPGLPPVPHVGGPLIGPGAATVLIGGLPAATMGDACICTGPPDTVVLGSGTVLIDGKPAARSGDPCAHGGTIAAGLPSVLIGDAGCSLSALPVNVLLGVMQTMPGRQQGAIAQTLALRAAAEKGQALAHEVATCPVCAKKYA